MELGFVEDDPAAGAAAPAVEWSTQRAADYRAGEGVARCWSGRND
jgi:hypothetical protein